MPERRRQHPGPVGAERIDVVPVHLHERDLTPAARPGPADRPGAGPAGRLHLRHAAPAWRHAGAVGRCDVGGCLDGAAFTLVPEAETGFTLFRPLPCPQAHDSQPNALAVRVAPNEDTCTALEAVCAARVIRRATVRGGVDSTVGAALADGRVVEPFVTEVLIQHGCIEPGADDRPEAVPDESLVDHTGGLADGRLRRGRHGMPVPFELVSGRCSWPPPPSCRAGRGAPGSWRSGPSAAPSAAGRAALPGCSPATGRSRSSLPGRSACANSCPPGRRGLVMARALLVIWRSPLSQVFSKANRAPAAGRARPSC